MIKSAIKWFMFETLTHRKQKLAKKQLKQNGEDK